MKTSKLKPRRMWANVYENGEIRTHKSREKVEDNRDSDGKTMRVAVIPLDDVPALVRTAEDAFAASYDGHLCKSDIVAMLTAIGVLPRARKSRK